MNKPLQRRAATFRSAAELYHADTCEPLEAASRRGEVRVSALGRGTYPGARLPADDLKELCLIGFWDAPRDQTWGLDWHRNEGLELGLVEAGQIHFAVEGRKPLVLGPGQLTITRPWQRHRVGNPQVSASRYSWLILDVGMRRPNQPWHWPRWLLYPPGGLRQLTTVLRQNEQPVWPADEEIVRCFRLLGKIARDGLPDPRAVARLKIHINELIVALADMLEHRQPELDEKLASSERTVRLFLEELRHRLDEPWTLDSMAQSCGLGRSRFASCCQQIANVTPVEYLTRCRVEAAARQLVAQPGASILEIALASGFQSSQYFATVFGRHFGCSPRRWRTQVPRARE